MREWKLFVGTKKYVLDLHGVEYSYDLPPSWKVELQIWEIISRAGDLEITDLQTAFQTIDVLSEVVALVLGIPPTRNFDDLFCVEVIQQVFSDVWLSLQDTKLQGVESTFAASEASPEGFSIAKALSMFAVECGWTPSQVLELPKVQVVELTKAISDYVSHKMKFQAAIHGVDVDGSKSGDYTQIDNEDEMQKLKQQGLPIEVI